MLPPSTPNRCNGRQGWTPEETMSIWTAIAVVRTNSPPLRPLNSFPNKDPPHHRPNRSLKVLVQYIHLAVLCLFNVLQLTPGIIRNKIPKPEECLEDPEVRKRKWTLPLGQVQLLSCYDSRAHILYVTIIRARKLQTRRPNGDARPDPLVRCVLLPGRKPENERRTRYLSLTSDPEWHQTMVWFD